MFYDFSKTKELIESVSLYNEWGKVTKLQGDLVECRGLFAQLNDVCLLKNKSQKTKAEVIGFSDQHAQLMLYDRNFSLNQATLVRSLGNPLEIKVGEELLGRVLNGLGEPLDNKPLYTSKKRDIFPVSSNSLDKEIITNRLELGIKSIDSLLTVGKGQRMGVFSGSGVGKSTLLSMIARNNQSDVNVIALVGERGREVKEFIHHYLGEKGLKKSILIVSNSHDVALAKVKSVFIATTIAEYFRDQGLNVVLMVDSLTRLAHAQRIIGTYLKEPPTSKGFPPSLFELLPSLLERAGNFKKGSITAFYSVLVEGDDLDEPITDAVRGILDGHIILSRKISQKALYPAIDIPHSISRIMPNLVDDDHLKKAYQIKEWLAKYYEMEDIINIGGYASGSNIILDQALEKISSINELLKQDINENISFDQSFQLFSSIFANE